MDDNQHQPFADVAAWLGDRYRRERFKSDRNAGERLGVERTTLRKYIDGLKVPPDDIVIRLAEKFGDDPAEMLALASRSRLAKRSGEAEEPVPSAFLRAFADELAGRLADEVAERVLERLATGPGLGEGGMETVMQRAGIEESSTLDDRIPVLFSGVIWEELTDAEKAGVIALTKRLMGRPRGKMGRRQKD